MGSGTQCSTIRKKYSRQLNCNTQKLQWILLFTLNEGYAKRLQNLTVSVTIAEHRGSNHHPLKFKATLAVLGTAQRSSR